MKLLIIPLIIVSILVVGLAFGLKNYLNQDIKSGIKNYLPVSKPVTAFKLEITNPDEDILVFDKNIIVSGRTNPESSIIISLQNSNYGIEADKEGQFSKVISLKSGVNNITITAFDNEGNSKQELRSVYFTEEKI